MSSLGIELPKELRKLALASVEGDIIRNAAAFRKLASGVLSLLDKSEEDDRIATALRQQYVERTRERDALKAENGRLRAVLVRMGITGGATSVEEEPKA